MSDFEFMFQLTNNGQWVRMIPSLSGGLYKFNGEFIEPIPVTADNLLRSSFRYSDDLVISGNIKFWLTLKGIYILIKDNGVFGRIVVDICYHYYVKNSIATFWNLGSDFFFSCEMLSKDANKQPNMHT